MRRQEVGAIGLSACEANCTEDGVQWKGKLNIPDGFLVSCLSCVRKGVGSTSDAWFACMKLEMPGRSLVSAYRSCPWQSRLLTASSNKKKAMRVDVFMQRWFIVK
jgi:hypothetical protein